MKRHDVEYSEAFLNDVRDQVAHFRKEGVSEATTDRWFAELVNAIDSLETLPKRYPVDEVQTATIGVESRKLVFRERYLVFYRVDDNRHRVNIDVLIHSARDRERLRDSVRTRVRRGHEPEGLER